MQCLQIKIIYVELQNNIDKVTQACFICFSHAIISEPFNLIFNIITLENIHLISCGAVFRRTWTDTEELLKEKSFFILSFVFLSEFVIRQVQTNIY